MKFSEQWLRTWVNPDVSRDELVARLSMTGLEVDSVTPAAGEFSGVVVGEILSAEQHPDADKLRVCQVAGNGPEPLQVVCGAPNAREGIKVPFATIGAVLPGDFKIKKAKLRGVESFGMLCAETELGVSEEDAGLWELPDDAPVGEDLRDYLRLDDTLIEVDLTPNRSDCLSIKGLAREVGVLCQEDVTFVAADATPAVIDDALPVTLSAGEACSRYVGRVIRNIDLNRPTPFWLRERLRRSGLRSIDPVVDVTNYVMLELGQPMHAFDLASLQGGIEVRTSHAGEKISLLDGSECDLNAGTLVITDDSGPIAMAGVMGGSTTAVGDTTRDIFLESAFFHPLAIVGRAREYGMHTDSSHRFERGVAPDLCIAAMERATQLLLTIVGGEAGPAVATELEEHLPVADTITLKRATLAQYLACDLPPEAVEDILNRLGLKLVGQDPEGWTVTVPSWRFDIAIEVDLIEEIARVHGYDNLPTRVLASPLAIEPRQESRLSLDTLRNALVIRGFREAITYSFVDPKLQRLIEPEAKPVDVANPISSDMAVMRTSLWTGLLAALQYNLNRQQQRVRLFETGLRFVQGGDGELAQEPMIAGLVYGERDGESWLAGKERVDFYDAKGHVEALLGMGGKGAEYRFEPASHPALHPGQTAAVVRRGETIGYLGKLHPSVQKQLDLPQAPFLFELKQAPLLDAVLPHFREISRFPEVHRDIAIVVDEEVAAQSLMDTARAAGGPLLTDLKIFDVYAGKGVETNRKSVAISLTFQEESRTLNETEVASAMDAIISALVNNYQATLRG